MKGIDVSSHNGNINWGAVKSSGVEVVIIKATEGVDFVDSYVNTHYTGAIQVGFNIGFYHFMSEKTDPYRQAEDFYNCIKDKTYNVMPTLDIEVNNYGRSAAEITDRCLTFINRFKELSGQDCMIYTGGYFGRDNLDGRIKNYPGWIAHYGVNRPMETGFNVVGHQYTETGSCSGINGNVDINNFNEGIFLGTQVVANNKTVLSYNEKVREIQKVCNMDGAGIAEDGLWGPDTERAVSNLPVAGLPYKTPNLTRWIQARLGCSVDGVFGQETYNSVINWQSNHGLVTDGIVGINTIKSLALA